MKLDKKTGIIFCLLIISLILTIYIGISKKDGFTSKSQQDFLEIQQYINPQKIYDMEIMKHQASQQELDYFNKNKMWSWSIPTIELYQSAIERNPYIRVNKYDATNYARTIYNEESILRVLYNQSKEAQFLINGILVKDPKGNAYEELPSGFGSFPYESGLQPDRTYDIIKCSMKNEDAPYLERIKYTGKDRVFGTQTKKSTPVDYTILESIIDGFKFKDKPCNPCNSMKPIPDYTCKFSVNAKFTNDNI